MAKFKFTRVLYEKSLLIKSICISICIKYEYAIIIIISSSSIMIIYEFNMWTV
jgi:hypothetical protein